MLFWRLDSNVRAELRRKVAFLVRLVAPHFCGYPKLLAKAVCHLQVGTNESMFHSMKDIFILQFASRVRHILLSALRPEHAGPDFEYACAGPGPGPGQTRSRSDLHAQYGSDQLNACPH